MIAPYVASAFLAVPALAALWVAIRSAVDRDWRLARGAAIIALIFAMGSVAMLSDHGGSDDVDVPRLR